MSGKAVLGLVLSFPLALWLGAGESRGDDLFLAAETVTLPQPAIKSLVDDFNRDGSPDVVVAHQDSAQVSLLLNDSSGGFLAPETHPVGLTPVALASGDVDGDGAPDLVAVNYASGSVSVFRNNGDGALETGVEVIVSGLQARAAQVADLDSDGAAEILVTDLQTSSLTVLRGDGDGNFVTHHVSDVLGNPHSLSVGDFDGDGAVDAAVTVYEMLGVEGHVQWFAGNGDGTLRLASQTRVSQGAAFRYSVAGDFDGDDRTDLCVLDLGESVFLLKNRGGWDFEVVESPCCEDTVPEIEVDARTWNGFILAADHDSDGDLDVLTRVRRGNTPGYRVLENDGEGQLGNAREVILDGEFRVLALADFDGDGLQDGLATKTNPQLVLYRGESPGRLIVPETYVLSQPPAGIEPLPSPGGPPTLVTFGTQTLQLLQPTGQSGELPPPYRFPLRSFQGLAVADFDGLPGPELALSDWVRGSVTFVSVGPDGLAENGAEVIVMGTPGRLTAGYFDADGFADLAVLHQGRAWLTVLLKPGTSTDGGAGASREEIALESSLKSIESGDLDADGDVDLLLGGTDLQVLLGDGTGKFPEKRLLYPAFVAEDMKVVELDGDDAPDLLVAGAEKLLVGLGVLEKDPPVFNEIHLPFTPTAISVGDVTGDSRPDVLLAAQERGAVAVLPASDGGALGPVEYYGVPGSPVDIALIDLEENGTLDVVAALPLSMTVSVLRATEQGGIAFRRGDANRDGGSDLTDAIVILGALFQGNEPLECPDAADCDDDGQVNITDAIYLLVHLFQGGSAPPAPGPHLCGPDPTEDSLPPCDAPCQ